MKRIYSIVFAAAVFCLLAASPATAQQENRYEVEQQVTTSYKDFRLSVGGGYAFRLGKIEKTGDNQWDDMNKKLRHGFTVDADAQYFFKEGWGLGLNVNYCSSSTSGNNVSLPGYGDANTYKEAQNVLFVGPSFVGRNESEKFLLISSVGIGPLFYMNPATVDGVVVNSKATTVGINAGIAGEYKLNAKTGLGLKLSYTLGTISSLNVEGQSADLGEQQFSLSNLMLTAFISFRTW